MLRRGSRVVSDRTAPRLRNRPERTVLETWLDQARAGSSEALGALFEGCRKYLLLIANRELDSDLRPRTSASDLVQESFVEVQRGFKNFRGNTEEDLFGWLHSILHNRLANAVRNHRYTAKRTVDREQPLEATPREHLDPSDEPTPSDVALVRDEERRLNLALAQLDETDRTVIRLRSWERLSFQEIGERLDRSAEAARKLWGRAVRRLEHVLHEIR